MRHVGADFVGVSFPQAPVTLFIILLYFESPATTFRLVKLSPLLPEEGYESRNLEER